MENRELLEAIEKIVENAVDKKIEPLKEDITGLKEDITGLKADMTEVKEDIAGLKADMTEVKEDVAGLKKDVKELRSDIERVDIKATKANVLLENQEKSIKLIAEGHGILNDKYEEMSKDISSLKESNERIENYLYTMIPMARDHDDRIKRLEKKIG